MTTLRDLITGSLRLIEELGAGQTATAEDTQDAFTAIVAMINSWSIQGGLVYTESVEAFPLVSAQALYTIGTGGNFNTVRPTEIYAANIDDGSSIMGLTIYSRDQYASIVDNTGIQGTPEVLYYDANYPLGNIRLYPTPAQTDNLILYTKKPITSFTSIDDVLVLPEGYERAFRFNLAMEIAPEFGKQASATVQSIAIESKNAVIAQNSKHNPPNMRVDEALLQFNNSYNIYSGK